MPRKNKLDFLPSIDDKEFDWEKKLKTISFLGAVAVAGHFIEEFDWHTGQFIIDHAFNTLQHPYAGYWGAMVGDALVRSRAKAERLAAIVLGTAVGDISAETYQSWDTTGNLTKSWLGAGQEDETLRDALAAGVAGVLIYPYQIRKRLFKSQS